MISARIPVGTFFRIHLLIILCCLLGHLGTLVMEYGIGYRWLFGLNKSFNMGSEYGVPAFASALFILLAGLAAAVIAAHENQRPGGLRWKILSAVFLFLAVDEAARFHEAAGDFFVFLIRHGLARNLLGLGATWIYVYALPLLGFALYMLPLLRMVPRDIAAALVISGAVYVLGAVVVEAIGSTYGEAYGKDLYDELFVAAEESLEMLGIALFLRALLAYAARSGYAVTLAPTPGSAVREEPAAARWHAASGSS
jgi:hypothetical protein